MWGTWTRAAIAAVILGFGMWVLRKILNPIVGMATTGPNSGHESVQTIGGWFAALTLPNLTLLAGIGIAVYVLGRSVVEKRGF